MSRSRDWPSTARLRTLADIWPTLERRGWLAERTPEVRSLLSGIARVRELDAGEALYHAGDRPNGVFGLVEGALDVGLPTADGRELTVHRADVGFWIGDLALFSKQRRLVSVWAAEKSRLVHLEQSDMARLIESHPGLVNDFYALTYRNMETTLRLLGNLTVSPSETRVALRLLFHDEKLPAGQQWIRLSQETLAEITALSVPTLQRALRRLERAGYIEHGYGRIRITDRAGLLHFCGDVTLAAETG